MTAPEAEQLAAMLKLVANANRLLILDLLAQGEHSVAEIEAASGIRQPTLSQQLGVLRDAGLIAAERAAKTVTYRLVAGPLTAQLRQLASMLEREPAASGQPIEKTSGASASQAAVFATIDRR